MLHDAELTFLHPSTVTVANFSGDPPPRPLVRRNKRIISRVFNPLPA